MGEEEATCEPSLLEDFTDLPGYLAGSRRRRESSSPPIVNLDAHGDIEASPLLGTLDMGTNDRWEWATRRRGTIRRVGLPEFREEMRVKTRARSRAHKEAARARKEAEREEARQEKEQRRKRKEEADKLREEDRRREEKQE